MTFSELMTNVGFFGLAVMVVLAALSIYSVGVILDKHRRFRTASRQSQQFKPLFTKLLHEGELEAVTGAAREHPDSYVARVVTAGIAEYEVARKNGSDPAHSLELVSDALEGSRVDQLIGMKRGLGMLATIGSTAPFIGLFGTVVGIINAFRGIAATGSGGMAAVSGGIAEALVATALGIFVAIPAVVAFNQFTGVLERVQVEMNQASTQLVNFLFKVPGAEIVLQNGDRNGRRDAAVADKGAQPAMTQRAAHAAR